MYAELKNKVKVTYTSIHIITNSETKFTDKTKKQNRGQLNQSHSDQKAYQVHGNIK